MIFVVVYTNIHLLCPTLITFNLESADEVRLFAIFSEPNPGAVKVRRLDAGMDPGRYNLTYLKIHPFPDGRGA